MAAEKQERKERSIIPAAVWGGGGSGLFTEKSWRKKIMKAGQWEGMEVG